MKLKSKNGLLVAYTEGIIVACLVFLAVYLKGVYSLPLWHLIILIILVLTNPIYLIALEKIFPAGNQYSVSGSAAVMGAVAVLILMPGFFLAILLGLSSYLIFWLIFSQANKKLFPANKKEEIQK